MRTVPFAIGQLNVIHIALAKRARPTFALIGHRGLLRFFRRVILRQIVRGCVADFAQAGVNRGGNFVILVAQGFEPGFFHADIFLIVLFDHVRLDVVMDDDAVKERLVLIAPGGQCVFLRFRENQRSDFWKIRATPHTEALGVKAARQKEQAKNEYQWRL